MNTMKSIKGLLGAGVVALATSQSASAAFSNGDLILSFQATGGLGATTTYVANLGAGYTYRDATADSLNIINLGSALSSIYGGTWYDRTDLYINLIGMRQNGGGPASNNYGPVVNGDTRQTVYAGRAKADNDPLLFNQYTGLNFSGNSEIATYNSTVATALASVNQASIAKDTVNTIEDYTTPDGILLANFTRFGNGDFNQAFSTGSLFSYNSVAYEGALTLQRLIRSDATTGSSAGQIIIPGAPAGSGSNEGFFAIRSSGQVDYIAPVPEPGTWAAMALFAGGAAFAGWRKRRMAKANA